MVLRIALMSLLVLLAACGGSTSATDKKAGNAPEQAPNGESLYILHCESCHGMDGAKGLSNAADLSKSTLSDKKIIDVIENGNQKGMMPFKDILGSRQAVVTLADFVKTLRKK